MKFMAVKVKTTSMNIASVMPVRKRLWVGYFTAVLRTGGRPLMRPNAATTIRKSKSALKMTSHTPATTMAMPETKNISGPFAIPAGAVIRAGVSHRTRRIRPEAVKATRSDRPKTRARSAAPIRTSEMPPR
jgi:hypothetical protein